jgi:hypothetical protein
VEKEKPKSNINMEIEAKKSRKISGKEKQSDKIKALKEKECKKSLDLNKRVIKKDDGRYLIYYDF